MSTARDILRTPDRTPKERRDMAELRHVGPVDWKGDMMVCHFRDGSSLMWVFDDCLCPVEFLVIDNEHDAAMGYALSCLATRGGWDEETLSHNIESNFPDLDLDDCDEIAATALAKFPAANRIN